jgi:tRNA G18 (ribose-2'-O)-methylase SpoU
VRLIAVEDPNDARIAMFVGLRDRDLRVQDGLFVAESDILIARAIQAGFEPVAVLIDATRSVPLPPELSAEVPVYGGSPEVIRRITGLGVHRGSLGVFRRKPVASVSDVLRGATRIAVLAGVVNPTNVGVIARSAVALGIDAMVLDEDCADPLYRRAARVAMGEIYGFPFAFVARLPGGLAELHDAGFITVALTPDDSADRIDAMALTEHDRVALVLGSEGHGLTDEVMGACHRRVRIPIAAAADSLNVGVAASIAFHEVNRNRS